MNSTVNLRGLNDLRPRPHVLPGLRHAVPRRRAGMSDVRTVAERATILPILRVGGYVSHGGLLWRSGVGLHESGMPE